jgi:trehalose utilization protein
MSRIRVTIWNEFVHENQNEAVKALYPRGIHGAIAEGLDALGDFEISTATLDQPEAGLPSSLLDATDVLIWWGHKAHKDVPEDIVERVVARVQQGMGLIVLHSAHYSRVFQRLMGTSCSLRWREAGEKERLWVVNPAHPIAAGIGAYVELPHEEMYGEFFDVPDPDELVFLSWFAGGEVFRSGAVWRRGKGRVFYFRPGHETYPTYFNTEVRLVIANAVRYVAFRGTSESSASVTVGDCLHVVEPIEPFQTR